MIRVKKSNERNELLFNHHTNFEYYLGSEMSLDKKIKTAF